MKQMFNDIDDDIDLKLAINRIKLNKIHKKSEINWNFELIL